MAKGQKKQKGGRVTRFPTAQATPAERERFNGLRGDLSASDFIVKLMDHYEGLEARPGNRTAAKT